MPRRSRSTRENIRSRRLPSNNITRAASAATSRLAKTTSSAGTLESIPSYSLAEINDIRSKAFKLYYSEVVDKPFLYSSHDGKVIGACLKKIHLLFEESKRRRFKAAKSIKSYGKLQASIGRITKQTSVVVKKKLKAARAKVTFHAVREARVLQALHQMTTEAQILISCKHQIMRYGRIQRKAVLFENLDQSARIIPVFDNQTLPPPLCGSIPAQSKYVCKEGDLVAAFMLHKPTYSSLPVLLPYDLISHLRPRSAPKPEFEWTLAEIKKFNSLNGSYEVATIMPYKQGAPTHTIAAKNVIPLPLMRTNPAANPQALFRIDEHVLALIPATTCFNLGKVINAPATPQDSYKIRFLEFEYNMPIYDVQQRYVIAFREGVKSLVVEKDEGENVGEMERGVKKDDAEKNVDEEEMDADVEDNNDEQDEDADL